VGLFDHVLPSERASDLALLVKRIREQTGLDVIPILVVEGRTDEPAFGPLCALGDDQVFSAGSRSLVEQLLVHLKNDPIDRCDCVYLVDCDGRGKAAHLSDRMDLVVTETCDLEADLVRLGVAERVTSRFVDTDSAAAMVAAALAAAMPMSVVRRAAHQARVSMKRDGLQLALAEMPEAVLAAWDNQLPGTDDVIAAVGDVLGWTTDDRNRVRAALSGVSTDAGRSALGKDILDALFRQLARDGRGDVRGWSRDHFHAVVRRELGTRDLPGWVVAERIARWSTQNGHQLMRDESEAA
jgi:hypothetical protein